MTYATKEDVKGIVDKAVENLSFVIQEFAKQVDERFNNIEDSIDRLTKTIDGFVKRLDDMEIDNTARDAHLARLERWIHEIANKTGVKLKTQ